MQDFLDFGNNYPVYKQAGWISHAAEDPNPYFLYVLVFTLLVFSFEAYLDLRQYRKYKSHVGKPLSEELELAKIPQKKVSESLNYGIDKIGFGIFESVVALLFLVASLFLGFIPFVWDQATRISYNLSLVGSNSSELYAEVVFSLVFMLLTTLYDEITTLPFSLYKTFVIEEKHGFNKMTLGLFFLDKLKVFALSTVIGGPLISVMIYIIKWGGQHFYFYVWAFFLAISLVLMHVYPEYIAPLFNKYEPLESGEVFDSVKNLAKEVGFPLTKLFVVDGSTRSAHSNAYFYGFFKNKRIVLYDTLMKQVETNELRAILGHEIGHWKLWHSIQGFVISQLYFMAMLVSYSFVQNSSSLISSFGLSFPSEKTPVLLSLFVFLQVFWAPIEKTLSFLMNCNSRFNEFAADKYANDLGMGKELSSGLVKITIENLGAATMFPDPLYSAYHFSHPPLVERLRAINTKKRD